MTSHLISDRSPTMKAVVDTVNKFQLVTSSQLLRLHYQGTPDGMRARQNQHLLALTKRGIIKRLDYRITTGKYGAAEFVYVPAEGGPTRFEPHRHDVTELYVRLKDRRWDVVFDPEEWARPTLGGITLHPDALVRLGSRVYLVEVDRSSERPSVLAKKMNVYCRAAQNMAGGSFPYVLWTARTPDRLRIIHNVIKARAIPQMFKSSLFDQAVGVICE
jgi:hypothetical protein